jgi:hypothetical protein
MSKVLKRLGVATALVLTVAGLAATAAQACSVSARGNNIPSFYYDGFNETGDCPTGVQATLYTTDPGLYAYGSPDESSSAWVGLAGSSAQSNAIGQVGWQKIQGDSPQLSGFAGVVEGLGWAKGPNSWTGIVPGDFWHYKVTYSSGTFHIFWNDMNTARYNYGGFSFPNDTCWTAYASGEVNSRANQMPGTFNNMQAFDGLEIRSWSGGSNQWEIGPNWTRFQTTGTNNWYLENGPTMVAGSLDAHIWDSCQAP